MQPKGADRRKIKSPAPASEPPCLRPLAAAVRPQERHCWLLGRGTHKRRCGYARDEARKKAGARRMGRTHGQPKGPNRPARSRAASETADRRPRRPMCPHRGAGTKSLAACLCVCSLSFCHSLRLSGMLFSLPRSLAESSDPGLAPDTWQCGVALVGKRGGTDLDLLKTHYRLELSLESASQSHSR